MANLHVSYEIPVLRVGVWPANVDMSAEPTPGLPGTYQFCGMVLAANASGVDNYGGAAVQLPAASGAAIVGVLQDNPKKNVAADVWLQGISKVKVSNTITIGQILMVDVNGNFLPATAGNFGVAMALAAGSSGDYIAALIQSFGKQ